MLKSQKYSNIYRNSYIKGEKILINNNIRIANKAIKKNNKKIGIYNISAEIINVNSGGSYKIKILDDENKFFSKGEEYYINFTNFILIKKVDEKIWKKLNLDYQKKLEKHIYIIYGKNIDANSNYSYSFADDSSISDFDFGLSEDEDLINDNIKIQKFYKINLLKNYYIINLFNKKSR